MRRRNHCEDCLSSEEYLSHYRSGSKAASKLGKSAAMANSIARQMPNYKFMQIIEIIYSARE
jgi:hypothetical protein